MTSAPAPGADVAGFTKGQAAELVGLVSRQEFTGRHVTLHSCKESFSRWAVTLGVVDGSICVKAQKLMPLVHKPVAQ